MIGVYVRISRDDNGENFETIENQRELLLEYAKSRQLGEVYSVYTDDNVSGSAFERKGLTKLKEDVFSGRINLLLLKDLSRLGRNNAKTLQWIDLLEEYGVRILTADGRYDSLLDNDTVGIETWANERYIRDISRKIRSCLHFKIGRGEYLGKAPFGYKKSENEKNKLVIDDNEAETVRIIYRLYRSGKGYTAIARYLDSKGCPSPGGTGWNRISVRRVLCSDVYIGNTVQGVSEKVSFKSKKTRRLPKSEWVITEGTHQGIVTREEFAEVQRLRQLKNTGGELHKGDIHLFRGVLSCGGCGSGMYARSRAGGVAYVCGNYARNGSAACSSHFVYENDISRYIGNELSKIFLIEEDRNKLAEKLAEWMSSAACPGDSHDELLRKIEACGRKQEMLYRDRLESVISAELFDRMNRKIEERLGMLAEELELALIRKTGIERCFELIGEARENLANGILTNEIVRLAIRSITVFDNDEFAALCSAEAASGAVYSGTAADFTEGAIVIDFRF
ncbi:MAG TPA: recombinase family protein [Clostridia bacterium]|nr:recombinase family protein [Clostridia bacterium]